MCCYNYLVSNFLTHFIAAFEIGNLCLVILTHHRYCIIVYKSLVFHILIFNHNKICKN